MSPSPQTPQDAGQRCGREAGRGWWMQEASRDEARASEACAGCRTVGSEERHLEHELRVPAALSGANPVAALPVLVAARVHARATRPWAVQRHEDWILAALACVSPSGTLILGVPALGRTDPAVDRALSHHRKDILLTLVLSSPASTVLVGLRALKLTHPACQRAMDGHEFGVGGALARVTPVRAVGVPVSTDAAKLQNCKGKHGDGTTRRGRGADGTRNKAVARDVDGRRPDFA